MNSRFAILRMLVVSISLVVVSAAGVAMAEDAAMLRWGELPPLPDTVGYSGVFVGVSHGTLIVAGGANFPNTPFADGGTKVWSDRIYVLTDPDKSWRIASMHLPQPLAYGMAVSYGDKVVCMGGANADGFYDQVFTLEWNNGDITITHLPELPGPCGYGSAVLIDSHVYVLTGFSSHTSTQALHQFWTLDLAASPGEMSWRVLTPWPGLERRQAVVGVYSGAVYLFGGIRFEADDQGAPYPTAPYLTDAYRYEPGAAHGEGEWKQISSLPQAVAAAPSPALTVGDGNFVFLGGADGSDLGDDPRYFKPFARTILVYNAKSDAWKVAGQMPEDTARLDVPVTWWRGGYVVPSGERGPGLRSPRVFFVTPRLDRAGGP